MTHPRTDQPADVTDLLLTYPPTLGQIEAQHEYVEQLFAELAGAQLTRLLEVVKPTGGPAPRPRFNYD